MAAVDPLSKCENSSFTLTFAVEVINLEVWTDHKEGWVELGPPSKGLKLSYTLYYGQTFDVHIVIYEHAAKIISGTESCWVRTWRFLERRWLTFTIRHAFPVRAAELKHFDIIMHVVPDSNGSGGTNIPEKIFYAPLEFGQRRYFGKVFDDNPPEKETIKDWVQEWIWGLVLDYIPSTHMDGKFNEPYPVTDIRHQDTIIYKIQEEILNASMGLKEINEIHSPTPAKQRVGKQKSPDKHNFFLKLSGNDLLAGAGRIVAFTPYGSHEYEIMVIISSSNLPAQDDVPVVFINVDGLFDAPLEEFRKLNISHLYTRWTLGEHVHDSKLVDLTSIQTVDVKFKDNEAIPLNSASATEITAIFLDNPYNIQLRGKKPREVSTAKATLFGHDKQDRDFGIHLPIETKLEDDQEDFVIATTEIDARIIARGLNAFIKGEYPLYPPKPNVESFVREGACTNDINLIRTPLKPKLCVPGSLILESQMTLEVSIGVVGCRPPKITPCFSRLFCIVSDPQSIMAILVRLGKLNDDLPNEKSVEMMTGFALDTGDVVILYVEGPRDGNILKIWDMSEEFYPKVKPVFSTSARYATRVYPEFLKAIKPFIVLKLYAPLSLMLACPSVYARPALPIPARIAALKLGRLMQYPYRRLPPRCALPTAAELKSFRLELCAPPRSYPTPHTAYDREQRRSSLLTRHSTRCVSNMMGPNQVNPVMNANVNWETN
ncbi:hypothetical protein NE865_12914 [Phthorimaea operculella]|nr:hypothetical protein NE865_12914 [Phthorimaea operculella]